MADVNVTFYTEDVTNERRKGTIQDIRNPAADHLPPGYVIQPYATVQVSGVSKAQAREYVKPWKLDLDTTSLGVFGLFNRWQVNVDPAIGQKLGANAGLRAQLRDLLEGPEWGCVIQSWDQVNGVAVVDVPIGEGRDLLNYLKDVTDKRARKRYWHFTDAFVDAVVAAGRYAVVTKTQAQNNLVNEKL